MGLMTDPERDAKVAWLHREYPWTQFVEGPEKEAMIDAVIGPNDTEDE